MKLGALSNVLRRYLRVSIVGLENVSDIGPMLIVANHSGFAGADAVLLSAILEKDKGLSTRILAHWTYFIFPRIARLANNLGLRKTSIKNAVSLLKRGHSVILFPEGEAGNFKPFTYRYHLQEFHTGLVCIARQANVPIVPVAIIGAEESHITLKSFNFIRSKRSLTFPIPLNLFPLPAKWTIYFGKPVLLPKTNDLTLDSQEVFKATWSVQHDIQEMILKGLKNRPYVFSPGIDKFCAKSKILSRLVELPKNSSP